MARNKNAWSDEESKRLEELVAEGWSARAIAAKLGNGKTRNAIIGRIGRMGLLLRNSVRDGPVMQGLRKLKPRKPLIRRKATLAPKAVAPVSPPVSLPPVAVEQPKGARAFPPDGPRPRLPRRAGRSVAASDAIAVLEPDQCRWPIGDIGYDGFHFCGERRIDAKHAYCEQHTVMAYKKSLSVW